MYRRKELDETIRVTMLCDFCTMDHPIVVYAASRMSTGEIRDCWRWAACRECAELIESEAWIRLKDRMVAVLRYGFRQRGILIPLSLAETAIEHALIEFFIWAIYEPGN